MPPSSPIRFPSIEGLRALEATARLCSFERAAHELSLTPSAVSKRVMTLENLLGISLFTRRANSLALTAAGSTYVEQAREVLRMLAAMHRDAHLSKIRRLKVTATPTFARQILAPNLSSFASDYPGIELELLVIAPLLDAPSTGADVEIRHGSRGIGNGQQLMHDVVTPMASPEFIRTLPPLRSPTDLKHVKRLSTPFESWEQWFRLAQVDCCESDRGSRFLDLGLAYEAAVNGQGVALCRPSLMGDWLERKALQPLFDVFAAPTGSYYLLPGSECQGTESFKDWLRALCSRVAERNLQIARSYFNKTRP